MKQKKSSEKKLSNLSLNAPFIEIHDNKEINIEGSKGIVEYDNNVIRINLGKKLLSIKGRGLTLQNLSPSNLSVKGYIISVEFLS